jgi:hypothetical protein
VQVTDLEKGLGGTYDILYKSVSGGVLSEVLGEIG